MDTTCAPGQAAFGWLGLVVAPHALRVPRQWPAVSLNRFATSGRPSGSFVVIEYCGPKLVVGTFGALVIAAAISG